MKATKVYHYRPFVFGSSVKSPCGAEGEEKARFPQGHEWLFELQKVRVE